jgi:hypothetical protein
MQVINFLIIEIPIPRYWSDHLISTQEGLAERVEFLAVLNAPAGVNDRLHSLKKTYG